VSRPLLDSRWLDITLPLRQGVPEWPGDMPYECRWTMQRSRGDSVNVSCITGSPHVGTHADAPRHIEEGWMGAEGLPLDAFVGGAAVVAVRPELNTVELEDLALPDGEVQRVLLRTECSVAAGRFPERWPVISPRCAVTLLERGLRLLGTDAPSVDSRWSRDLPVHRLLIGKGAAILENLDLAAVAPGRYTLLALPMRLEGLDAAPVRALLAPEG
jgi:arylformamidase